MSVLDRLWAWLMHRNPPAPPPPARLHEVGRWTTIVTERSGRRWEIVHTGYVLDFGDMIFPCTAQDQFSKWRKAGVTGLLWVAPGRHIPIHSVVDVDTTSAAHLAKSGEREPVRGRMLDVAGLSPADDRVLGTPHE